MQRTRSDGCPVTTDNSNIKATVFIKPAQTLISIASWAPELVYINLNINWEYLGLSRRDTIIVSPKIESFQPARIFEVDESIPVEQGKGWLLILGSKH